jgi:hypothetical protein
MSTMTIETASFVPVPLTVSTLAAQRSVYLRRLERLQRLRLQHESALNQRGIRLLDRSVFAAYCACRDIGVEPEARQILQTVASDETTPPPPSDILSSES